MTPAELADWIEQEAGTAEEMGASAPVASVLRSLLPKIYELNLKPNGNGDRPDRMLKAADIAERLSIGVRTVYANRHGWPFVKELPGGSIRFSEQGLERWLSRR